MEHIRGKKTAIRVELDSEVMERIAAGPLKPTGGKGAAPWVRNLILNELNRYEQSQEVQNGSYSS